MLRVINIFNPGKLSEIISIYGGMYTFNMIFQKIVVSNFLGRITESKTFPVWENRSIIKENSKIFCSEATSWYLSPQRKSQRSKFSIDLFNACRIHLLHTVGVMGMHWNKLNLCAQEKFGQQFNLPWPSA